MTMLCAYHTNVRSFSQDCLDGSIADKVSDGFNTRFGYLPSESEVSSWRSSLPAFGRELAKFDIVDAYVFIELQMPLSSARCDLLLVGKTVHGHESALVVELKQWSRVSASAVRNTVSVLGRPMTHPSIQVRSYVNYLKHFHGAFTESRLELYGCAYLHNAVSPETLRLLRSRIAFNSTPEEFPVFDASDPSLFGNFVRESIGNGQPLAPDILILEGRIMPSKKLLDLVDAAVQGNYEWRLLDEQILAFNKVISLVAEARTHARRERHILIVRGGPGTGKSVIAIQLLAYAARHGWKVAHVTGSKAFQTVLQAKTEHFADAFLKRIHNARFKRELPVKEIFATFRDVARLGSTSGCQLDLVIGDEGHRLWDYRRNTRTYEVESSVPMIEEILLAAPVAVMFLDDNQGVRANEIGSVRYLEENARRLGIAHSIIDLNTQFRCAGSKSYLDWVDNLLGFQAPHSLAWQAYGGYEFNICSTPLAMQEQLSAVMQSGNRCRLVAGFCWRWSEPRPDGSLVNDVSDPLFAGWSAPWIEKGDRYANPRDHRYFLWATDNSHFSEVGSIYSVQGFEFDYVGVIFGNDLVYRNGSWQSNLRKNKDRQFQNDLRRRLSVAAHTVDEVAHLRNIYRVLLTRGMKGTFVYFMDPETRTHFERSWSARCFLQSA